MNKKLNQIVQLLPNPWKTLISLLFSCFQKLICTFHITTVKRFTVKNCLMIKAYNTLHSGAKMLDERSTNWIQNEKGVNPFDTCCGIHWFGIIRPSNEITALMCLQAEAGNIIIELYFGYDSLYREMRKKHKTSVQNVIYFLFLVEHHKIKFMKH